MQNQKLKKLYVIENYECHTTHKTMPIVNLQKFKILKQNNIK